jgi:hypothetical protein
MHRTSGGFFMVDQWIPIFRSGLQTDSSGNSRLWTETDLDTIADGYNPAIHEAPAVVGHPKDNAPAFGWVESLRREGATLYAKFKQVAPEFAQAVKDGLYKKRSIALYPDLSLRHVGFLGAAAPAVKGLADIAFDDGEAVVIEFNGVGAMLAARPEETNTMTEEERAALQGQLDEARTKLAEAETAKAQFAEQLAKAEKEKRQVELNSFCEGLIGEGKLPAGLKEKAVEALEFAAADSGYQFSDGTSALAGVKTLLSSLPVMVEFGEHATKDKAVDQPADQSALGLAQKAVEFQETEARAGRTISMTDAVNHVKKGGN